MSATREQIVNDSDRAMTVLGVPGRLTHRTRTPAQVEAGSKLWARQRWISEGRPIDGYGVGAMIRAELRFDDDCGNGHNSFAITAEVRRPKGRDIEAGGCMHDEIARIFPELEPLIKWHLTSSDGPMHYAANTVYHAGDRDHYGLRKGEIRQMIAGKSGLPMWELVALNSAGEEVKHPLASFSADRLITSAEQPADPGIRLVYVPCNRVGEGKARELDHARSSAVWPEATDEQLSAEPAELRAALEARLPALLVAFRAAMESAGFLWE